MDSFQVCNAMLVRSETVLVLNETVLVLSETVLVLVIECGLKESYFNSTHELPLHATKLFLLHEYEHEHEHKDGPEPKS